VTRKEPNSEIVTLHVPFRMVKRGGRKETQQPERSVQPPRADATLIKALARAFRWKRMLESGEFTSAKELAEREGIMSSYLTRVLRLTLLAPNIVEAILEGKQGRDPISNHVEKQLNLGWPEQTLLTIYPDEERSPIDTRCSKGPTGKQ
jgi:hypothetical protein